MTNKGEQERGKEASSSCTDSNQQRPERRDERTEGTEERAEVRHPKAEERQNSYYHS